MARHKDSIRAALTDLNPRQICQRIYGDYTGKQLRQLKAWLSGAKPMPVEIFWEVFRAFPYLDLERSLQDIYDRRLMRRAKSAITSLTGP